MKVKKVKHLQNMCATDRLPPISNVVKLGLQFTVSLKISLSGIFQLEIWKYYDEFLVGVNAKNSSNASNLLLLHR